MDLLPKTEHPLIVRTDFSDQATWDAICELVRAPARDGSDMFYAYVDFFEAAEFRNLTNEELLARVPPDYGHSFLFVVDTFAAQHGEFPILVIDLYEERGRMFRAIPAQIQGIENNLSIANMSFFEFADSVDSDGIFRGFPEF